VQYPASPETIEGLDLGNVSLAAPDAKITAPIS